MLDSLRSPQNFFKFLLSCAAGAAKVVFLPPSRPPAGKLFSTGVETFSPVPAQNLNQRRCHDTASCGRTW